MDVQGSLPVELAGRHRWFCGASSSKATAARARRPSLATTGTGRPAGRRDREIAEAISKNRRHRVAGRKEFAERRPPAQRVVRGTNCVPRPGRVAGETGRDAPGLRRASEQRRSGAKPSDRPLSGRRPPRESPARWQGASARVFSPDGQIRLCATGDSPSQLRFSRPAWIAAGPAPHSHPPRTIHSQAHRSTLCELAMSFASSTPTNPDGQGRPAWGKGDRRAFSEVCLSGPRWIQEVDHLLPGATRAARDILGN